MDDVLDVVRGRIGAVPLPRPRGSELAAYAAGKAVFVGWALVIPALVFRSPWIAPVFLLGAFALGVALSTVFQLAHAVPDAEFHSAYPGEHRMPRRAATSRTVRNVDARCDCNPGVSGVGATRRGVAPEHRLTTGFLAWHKGGR